MKSLKMLFLSVLVVIMLCLCGCKIFPANTYELLSPPELTGDYYPIEKALAKSVGKDYTLRYPSGGDHRSAVTICDINDDGENKAFAFYSLNNEEMHINMIVRNGEEWVSVDDQTITAGSVERIDFCDLDGDGNEEVIVGWEMQASAEKQLAVYSVNGKKMLQRMLQRYSEYTFCDLDGDKIRELFVQQLNTTDAFNRASLYRLEKEGVTELASCSLDRSVKTIVSIVENTLSNGQKAIYIDELKSSGAVTEVLYLNKGQLVNPLLEQTLGENIRSARSSSLMCKDVNHDGILEIPIFEELPMANGEVSAEKVYCTRWSSFTGEMLVSKQSEIINQNDGYSMIIPETWVGNIAVSVDSNHHSRVFYVCDADKNPVARLLELNTYKIKDWDSKQVEALNASEEICRTNDNVIIGKVYCENEALSITMEELKKMIYLN